MDKALHLTMFVAISKHPIPTFVTLYDIVQQIMYMRKHAYGPLTITKIVPKHKGKLHSVCKNDSVGSISVGMRYKGFNINALVFKNSIRITAGVPTHVDNEVHERIDAQPLKDYVQMINDGIRFWSDNCIIPDSKVEIVNINAQTRKEPIPNFFAFAERIFDNVTFDRVQLPFCHQLGAVATCHIYAMKDSNCSAKVQHTGAIQYMGFKEIDTLHVFSTLIDAELI